MITYSCLIRCRWLVYKVGSHVPTYPITYNSIGRYSFLPHPAAGWAAAPSPEGIVPVPRESDH